MLIRLLLGIVLIGLPLNVLLVATASAADDVELTARPAKCISLRKGRVCYQTIRLRWNATVEGDYCLWAKGRDTPLECWTQAPMGSHKYSFASSKNLVFYLTPADADAALATTQVSVAWVYRNRAAGRPSWRLF